VNPEDQGLRGLWDRLRGVQKARSANRYVARPTRRTSAPGVPAARRQSYGGQAHRRQPESIGYAIGFVLILLTLGAFAYVGIDWATGAGKVAGLGQTAAAPSPSPAAVVVTAIPSPSAVASPPPAETTYTVKAGDIPDSIAREHGVSLTSLLQLNNITDPTSLQIGQQLRIPPRGTR
jgi:nucleoid-associated protein YgaU